MQLPQLLFTLPELLLQLLLFLLLTPLCRFQQPMLRGYAGVLLTGTQLRQQPADTQTGQCQYKRDNKLLIHDPPAPRDAQGKGKVGLAECLLKSLAARPQDVSRL